MLLPTALALTTCLLAPAAWEAPPAPFQTRARPAEGETVAANPPCFVYPAKLPAAASYVVEYSRDAGFPAAETRQLTSRYLLAVPRESLAAGRWWWRARPGGPSDGGGAWSAVRGFTVPAEAPVVPFPDVAALVRQMGRAHPRVAVTAADLAATRRRAAERFGESWRQQLEARALAAEARSLLPEPEFLPATQDTNRIAIYQRIFQTTRPFFGEMRQLAEDYLLTGQERSGQQAKRRLLHILSWNPRGSTALNHNDEPATEIVRYSATVLDWIQPLLTAEEKQRCQDCLLVRLDEMRARWRQRPFEMYPYESHNMGYYLPDGLEACLALAGEAPVDEMLEYTLLQLWSPFYPPYGDADGGWCEGPSYWAWSTAVFAHAYRLVELATGVPVHQRTNVRHMPYYKLYGNPPYAKVSPFGDGHEGAAVGGHTMRQLAALFGNPYANWYADQQQVQLGGLAALLYDTSALASRAPDDLPQGRAFRDVGLAAMHSVLSDPTSNVQVLLRSSPFGSISHAYADQNAFTLDAYGEPLLIASGYYQLYGHPHHRDWTWQTKAANAVLVNGQGQTIRDWTASGRIGTFQTTAAGDYAVGDATPAYGGRLTKAVREIVFLRPLHTGGEPITIVRDTLAAPQPATYQFLLHALERMAIDEPHRQVDVQRGAARCRVDFLASSGLRFEQTDQFPVAPFRAAPNQWHLTAATTTPAAATESLLVIQPYRAGAEGGLLTATVTAPLGGPTVRLTDGRRTIEVSFGEREDQVAAVASRSWRTGHLHSAVMFAGRRLSSRGCTLTADHPAAVAATLQGGRPCLSSDAPRGTRLTAEQVAWEQPAGPLVQTPPVSDEPAPVALQVEGQAAAPFSLARRPWVQRRTLTAAPAGGPQLYGIEARVDNTGDGPLALSLAGSSWRQVVPGGQRGVALTVPVAAYGAGRPVTLVADESLSGRLVLSAATARRAYGVNLLPNASFEEGAAGWRAGTIDRGAECTITAVRGGRTGASCLEVTCTKATGGDFGAYLTWPGVPATDVDRRFRLACWVRADAASEAAVQVCSANWQFWQNTPRRGNRADWTESAVEFVLPKGVDLTHLRLHMTAKQVDAKLTVDEVSLVELPLSAQR